MADEPDELDGIQDVQALRREAARYRRQLRETASERDAFKQQLDRRDKAELERLAADTFIAPDDVWAVTDLSAMRGEDGVIDLDRAHAEFDRIAESRPHWKKAEVPPPESGHPDVHGGAREAEATPLSFGQALRDARRAG